MTLKLKEIKILTQNWTFHQIARAKHEYELSVGKPLPATINGLKCLDKWHSSNNLKKPSKAAFRSKKLDNDWLWAWEVSYALWKVWRI